MDTLPPPPPSALENSQKLLALIQEKISQQGVISFAEYMQLALYAPGLGYYSSAPKFGLGGDFTTAPEISPLFAHCLAEQIKQVFSVIKNKNILEFGGGSGRLAVDLLKALAAQNCLPEKYFILELSAKLKQHQYHLLLQQAPELLERVIWLDTLPAALTGVIIANEVLDAMPVNRFIWGEEGLNEFGVSWQDGLVETLISPSLELSNQIEKLSIPFNQGYSSEINLLLPGWINSLANLLKEGLILLIDYGFPRQEYYHPDRWMGTLMCHYRQYAHTNPYLWPGLQDITAHVDFTAVAAAALASDLEVAGYTTQADFLIHCGIIEYVENMQLDAEQQYNMSQQIKRLLLPSEMGELFKVMALTKNLAIPLQGFMVNDKRERLGLDFNDLYANHH